MQKAVIASIQKRVTNEPVYRNRWGKEIEFDMSLVGALNAGFIYIDCKTEKAERIEIEALSPGMDGLQLYTDKYIYDLKYIN
jgi:hypothetical protein